MSDLGDQTGRVPARQSAEYVYRRVRDAILDVSWLPARPCPRWSWPRSWG